MAGTKGSIGFEHVGIGTALARNRLVVPVNQREYSWEEKHVLTLFQDFSNSLSKAAYFLGTIVLTTGKAGSWEVADGQQRLATTTILLAAIRDYFLDRGDELLVNSIEHDFLFTVVRETRETVPRLTLNVGDNEFFRKRILSRAGSPERKVKITKPSHALIDDAAKIAAKHVGDVLRPHAEKNRAPVLNTWLKFVEEAAQVILLKVPDDLNAFVMFETLNDRGLRTSQSDLLKNYLFGEADDRLSEAQQKWAAMTGTLDSLGDSDITLVYLRHLAISLYGPTREREVFEKIKEKTAGKAAAIGFLDALAENANDYVALLTPNHAKWNAYPPGVRNSIRTMNELKATPLRPLMLAIARKFQPGEADKAFRLLLRWAVRFLIVGGLRSGSVEEAYSVAAQKVSKDEITTGKGLLSEVRSVIPTDKEFEAAFATARVSQNFLARYYLRALELKEKASKEPEWIPNDDIVINLEHVLPENPGTNWPSIDEDTAAAFYRRIGNMALLQASKNTIIGNSDFAAKRPILKVSTFKLTSEIGQQKDWGPEQITKRQQRLAKLAVETWPIDVT